MGGTISAIEHTDQIKVEGDIDWIPFGASQEIAGIFKAVENFRWDSSPPAGWTAANGSMDIQAQYEDHKKVLRFQGTTTSGVSSVQRTFTASASGTWEHWNRIDHLTDTPPYYVEYTLESSTGEVVMRVRAIHGGDLEIYGGAGLLLTVSWAYDTWAHIRVDFDCTASRSLGGLGKFTLITDGSTLVTDADTVSDMSSKTVDRMIATADAADTVMILQFDAWGISWDAGYSTGDNLELVEEKPGHRMEGEVTSIELKDQVRVEGEITPIQHKDQIRVQGDIDWIQYKEQIRVEGEITPIVLQEQIRMDGDVTPIDYKDQVRVEGYLDWIVRQDQVRAWGFAGYHQTMRMAGWTDRFDSSIRSSGVVREPDWQLRVLGYVLGNHTDRIRVDGTVRGYPYGIPYGRATETWLGFNTGPWIGGFGWTVNGEEDPDNICEIVAKDEDHWNVLRLEHGGSTLLEASLSLEYTTTSGVVEFWCKVVDAPSVTNIVRLSSSDSAFGFCEIRWEAGQLLVNTYTTTTIPMTEDEWHHIRISFDHELQVCRVTVDLAESAYFYYVETVEDPLDTVVLSANSEVLFDALGVDAYPDYTDGDNLVPANDSGIRIDAHTRLLFDTGLLVTGLTAGNYRAQIRNVGSVDDLEFKDGVRVDGFRAGDHEFAKSRVQGEIVGRPFWDRLVHAVQGIPSDKLVDTYDIRLTDDDTIHREAGKWGTAELVLEDEEYAWKWVQSFDATLVGGYVKYLSGTEDEWWLFLPTNGDLDAGDLDLLTSRVKIELFSQDLEDRTGDGTIVGNFVDTRWYHRTTGQLYNQDWMPTEWTDNPVFVTFETRVLNPEYTDFFNDRRAAGIWLEIFNVESIKDLNPDLLDGDEVEVRIFVSHWSLARYGAEALSAQMRVEGVTQVELVDRIRAEGIIGFYHWDNIRAEGDVEGVWRDQIRAEGVVYEEYAEQIRVEGVVPTEYENGIRVVGQLDGIPHQGQIRSEGTVLIVDYKEQVRTEGTVFAPYRLGIRTGGDLDGADYVGNIRNEGEIVPVYFWEGARAEGELVLAPYASGIRTEGGISGIPHTDGRIMVSGDLIVLGDLTFRIRVGGWHGDKPRNPPYNMRMLLDHFISRMRGTVRLYHFPVDQGTYEHSEYVKPDPVIYNLTGYAFFTRNRHIRTETKKWGMADTYAGHLVINTANLPDGLDFINEYHDIVEYNDPELGVLRYRFKEHGISFEEWHGVVEYKLESMHPLREYELLRKEQVMVQGSVIGELYDRGVMVRGYVKLQRKDQVRVEGTIDYQIGSHQIEATGEVVPFYVWEQFRVEGETDDITHTHNIRTEGEIDWIVGTHQIRMEGLPQFEHRDQIRAEGKVPNYWNGIKVEGDLDPTPHSEGMRVDGLVREDLMTLFLPIIEKHAYRMLRSDMPPSFLPPLRRHVMKFESPTGTMWRPGNVGHYPVRRNIQFKPLWKEKFAR